MSTSTVTVDGVVYQGERIGYGSWHRDGHTHAGPHLPASLRDGHGRKVRCPACRWQEVSIYAIGKEHYLLVSIGHTNVPGEERYEKSLYTRHPFEVLEFLIVRNREGKFLNAPSRTALAQAASEDEELERVYLNLPAGL